jgi:hypothetical protein
MFLNITYLISSRIGNASQRSRTVSLINTYYISGWQNGDCQTFAKGLFLLTNCSQGFRSVRLLVRRHRLPHFLRRFCPLQSESLEQTALIFAVFPRGKTFQELQHLPTLLLDKLGNR